MIINLYHVDILIFSIMLPLMLIFGSSHEEQIFRAIVVSGCGLYAVVRYFLLKPVCHLLYRKYLLVWLGSFFSLYFFYGNFYMVDVATYGSNSSAMLLLLFLITVVLFLSPYSNDKLKLMLEISFGVALFVYIAYIIYGISSMTMEEMVLYRMGESVDGESIVKGNSNTVALTISTLSVFLFYEVFDGTYKKIAVIPLVLSIGVILFTGSKAGLFSVLLYVFLYQCVCSKINVKKILIMFLVIGIIICVIFNNDYLYLLLGERVEDFLASFGLIDTPILGNSTNERSEMYAIGIDMWFDAPVFGNGLGAFSAYSVFRTFSHNTYTEILSSMGIVGFITFYFLPVLILVKVVCYRNLSCVYLKVVLVSSIVGFFFDITSIKFLNYVSMLIIIIEYIFVSNCEKDRIR